jgi:glycosyltransferase involved in cell wall biosynthesis
LNDPKKVTVIIPAYNEEVLIEDTVNKVKQALDEMSNKYPWELILVDDGSKDKTGAIMDKLAFTDSHISVVHHKANYGIGRALKTGFKEASGDIIITLDADLSYSIEHIEKLLRKMEETDADIVSASCYAPGGKVENVPFKRALMSRIGNILLTHAMGRNITIATCMVMACKREAIKSLDLVSDDKDLTPEMLYKAIKLGLRIEEIPATLRWSNSKLNKAKMKKRGSRFKLRKNTITHLFILFWSRPFMLFLIPGITMFILGLLEAGLIVYRFIAFINVRAMDLSFNQSMILGARDVISQYTPSLILTGGLLVLGIQFVSLGFLAIQAQRNFNELYHLIHRSIQKKNE